MYGMGVVIDKKYRHVYEQAFREELGSREAGYFDEAALPSYTHSNRLMKWLFWKRIEAALGLAGEIGGQRVLDFGCGGGVLFLYLKEEGCEISGCDNEHADLAGRMCERLGIDASLGRDLGEFDGQYDTIFALDVLEHVEDLGGMAARLRDLLAEGGQLIVSGPTENVLYRMGRRLAGFSGDYHVRNIYDIERVLGAVGLGRVGCRVLYWPASLFRVSRWQKRSEGRRA